MEFLNLLLIVPSSSSAKPTVLRRVAWTLARYEVSRLPLVSHSSIEISPRTLNVGRSCHALTR